MAQHATSEHPQPAPSDLPVGEILRRTRLHYDKSIQDIESVLRIRADQIEAIEQGNAEKLPARVYAIGFVRSYSEFLGLDGDKMVALFKSQSAGQDTTPELNFPIAANDSKAPPFWLAGVCVLVLIIGLAVSMSGEKAERAEIEAVPAVPPALKSENLERAMNPPPAEEETQTAPSDNALNEPQTSTTASSQTPEKPARKGITLKIKENSWVEIRDLNDKVILSRVLKAGEKYFIPERANLSMSIGNAGGIEVELDGKPLETLGGTLGPRGQVIRKIPLNSKVLQQRFAPGNRNSIENLSR